MYARSQPTLDGARAGGSGAARRCGGSPAGGARPPKSRRAYEQPAEFIACCSCVIAWLFSVWISVACVCIFTHVCLPASGHACSGHGAQVGL